MSSIARAIIVVAIVIASIIIVGVITGAILLTKGAKFAIKKADAAITDYKNAGICKYCGAVNEKHAKKCKECGAPLNSK